MEFYYWLRDTSNPKFKTVYCIVRIDGDESVDFSTKIKIQPFQWNQKEQCFEGKNSSTNEKDLKCLERRLKEIKEEIEIENPKEPISPNEIVSRHREAKKNEKAKRAKVVVYFRDCMRDYMKNRTLMAEHGRITESTFDVANGKVVILMQYLAKKNFNRLKPHEITEKFMQQFKEDFIEDGYADSTIAKYESFIKTVLNYSRKKEIIKFSTLQDYSIEQPEEKDPIYPTRRELDRMIMMADGSEKYMKVMDIYLFCAYTSLSIGDYERLSEDNFELDSDGDLMILTPRGKTGTLQRIPLNKDILNLLEKFKTELKSGILLPKKNKKEKEVYLNLPDMSGVKLNEYLKEIALLANVKKHLTFHSSRKFQASFLINTQKVDSLIVREVLGWKDDRQFKRYTKIDYSTIKSHVLKE
jgi:integrase